MVACFEKKFHDNTLECNFFIGLVKLYTNIFAFIAYDKWNFPRFKNYHKEMPSNNM